MSEIRVIFRFLPTSRSAIRKSIKSIFLYHIHALEARLDLYTIPFKSTTASITENVWHYVCSRVTTLIFAPSILILTLHPQALNYLLLKTFKRNVKSGTVLTGSNQVKKKKFTTHLIKIRYRINLNIKMFIPLLTLVVQNNIIYI